MATISRRGLLVGLGSMLAAPAIVHAGSLMPVRPLPDGLLPLTRANYEELIAITRKAFVPRLFVQVYGGIDRSPHNWWRIEAA